MLQEVKDLQNGAVSQLCKIVDKRKETTFRAPTGSGKTRMMADFMNRILMLHPNVVFLVSTLSKGNLAEQNYKVFKDCSDKNIFPQLNPLLISSETSGEERVFIEEGYNVYVLPRDLFKDKSKLKDEGALVNFLQRITANLFGNGQNKKVWLIKDECHQATNNLAALAPTYFDRIINFSATPKLNRGQVPDVEITDDAAMNARLIKRIEWGSENDNVETAICKFEEIRENYVNLLGVNPCLIIQISNKEKAELEWLHIESILNKTEHQGLKWMSIVDKKEKCRTNDKVGKLPVERWKDYAKENASTIDIIVFKMVISEGWDIPRACMLYQVRDTTSKQLDEQVMGRVRRNPRLIDFENLSEKAQKLALTAWVWGIQPIEGKKSRQVKLFGDEKWIPNSIKIKTTRLIPPTERVSINVSELLEEKAKNDITHSSIFELYGKLQKTENGIQNLCYTWAKNINDWLKYCEHIDTVSKAYNNYICDYEESMEVVRNSDGSEREVSFPLTSLYVDNENYQNISDWVWKRKDGNDKFSFDSEAEREWASILKDISHNDTDSTVVGEPNPNYGQMRTDGTLEPQWINSENKYLWGKNYTTNSEIKFEYYLDGIHSSYPDFVMKDKHGNIHLFEVKSVNISSDLNIDSEEYKEKITALRQCYKQSSILTGQFYYLPILRNEEWQITRFYKGDEQTLNKRMFINSLSAPRISDVVEE
ncbi:MAG: DEAD/DEAH box helicase family protein [Paludibacteraceae bacterium]|nr:DEAD/DEAH box helicase family protein [Paludibacteraceae bacterium]